MTQHRHRTLGYGGDFYIKDNYVIIEDCSAKYNGNRQIKRRIIQIENEERFDEIYFL